MPNQPAADTITVSFTMPRELADAVQRHAKIKLTNKSDIIRRALIAYLPPEEAEAIMKMVLNDGGDRGSEPLGTPTPTKYPKAKSARKKRGQ